MERVSPPPYWAWRPGPPGGADDAESPVTPEAVDWAGVILVIESAHRPNLAKHFPDALRGKRVVCLDVPDDFADVDPELVRLLWDRVTRSAPVLATQESV